MTDEEILHKYVDLSGSELTTEGKDELMNIITSPQKGIKLKGCNS